MTLATIPSYLVEAPQLGAVPGGFMDTALGSDATFVMNAVDDKLAIVFQYDGTNTPDLISFRVTAATAGTDGDIQATLQNMGAGAPTGAVTNSGTGTATISTTGVKTISGMAGTASLTTGTVYAIMLHAVAGSSTFDRSLTILATSGTAQGGHGFPYYLTKDVAGGWTNAGGTNMGMAFGLANSGGTYFYTNGWAGAYTATLPTFSASTNPDERGNRFVEVVPRRMVGARILWTRGSIPGANDDMSISLYTTHTGTPSAVATTGTIEGEGSKYMSQTYLWTTPYTTTAGVTYAIAVKQIGTDSSGMPLWTYSTTGQLPNFMRSDFYSTTANDGGSFTDLNTAVYAIFPVYDQIDDGAGGGGRPEIRGSNL